jgi:hypothetical protein
MKFVIQYTFFVIVLLNGCTQTNKLANKNVCGIYCWKEYPKIKSEGKVCSRQIVLNEDSTFAYSFIEGTLRVKTIGTWQLIDNKLILFNDINSINEVNFDQDTSAYFLKKVFGFRNNRLYEKQIQKCKGNRKNYYEKLMRDKKPVGNK